MILPAYVLLDILKCMNREELLKVQETTRVINDIIRQDFTSKPLRSYDEGCELVIERNNDNELRLQIRPPNGRYAPTIPGCQECDHPETCRQQCPQHSHSIDEMRPFLADYIRYGRVTIHSGAQEFRLIPYSPEQVALLESISHEFLEFAYPCLLKMVIRTNAPSIGFTRNSYFRAENNRTKEVIELRCVARAEVKDKFDVDISSHLGYAAWIVERRLI
ncbi:hypothetical protein DdX_14069 [Ditylenchus destructor]|uniref:F-box domain-containing protein n=1 Tax=Ditylenchus destructor TaxID=166010 RepID=A0AAD4R213_9BILA|nr:hypothetical protein DdX_14069 [Ditylenchus destructor]